MTTLLTLKEKIKSLFTAYDYYIIPVVKFLVTLVSLLLIGGKIGFSSKIMTVPIVGLIAVVSAILPTALIVFIVCAYMLIHIYALSLELAVLVLILFALMYLLYYRFAPKDGVLLFLVPVLFLLKIPFLVPLLVGILLTPVSIVSVTFGTMIYYILDYVSNNAVTIRNLEADSALQKMQLLFDVILKNQKMYVTIIVFAIVIIVVYVIRRRMMDHAGVIGVAAGALIMVALFLIASIAMNVSTFGAFELIIGSIISLALALVVEMCRFPLDYSRVEHTQFEDDDYYYYVKAVPKVSIAVPNVKVKRINTKKRRRK